MCDVVNKIPKENVPRAIEKVAEFDFKNISTTKPEHFCK